MSNPFDSGGGGGGDGRKSSSGGTNPFSSSFDEQDPKGGGGGGPPSSSGGAAAAASSNPFDFGDVDFNKVQQRRERARAAKEREEAERAAAAAARNEATASDEAAVNRSADNAVPSSGGGAGGNRTRPNIISSSQRSKTTGSSVELSGSSGAAGGGLAGLQSQKLRVQGLFGFGSGKQQNEEEMNAALAAEAIMEEAEGEGADGEYGSTIVIGNRKLVVWPYDDYHLTQQTYYEKLDRTKKQKREGGGDDGGDPSCSKSGPADAGGGGETGGDPQSSIPIFSRPADPPDILTAVRGVSLSDFESKAEERAIAIVSTWLFDVGLIDELLVNGGMTTMYGASRPPAGAGGSVDDDPDGPSKMDREIAKLRNSTKRQLALINARLNDGVAATGLEVQELVNAVNSTKEDIGRLRELSTYDVNDSCGEDDSASQQFMLTKYPKLKQAINARRNLARCFRELDFFSHIPATCDRLRDELHGGEWTAHEWSSLRSVCREHVELEIFLVEAEAGMKKRLEEEAEEQQAAMRSSRGRAAQQQQQAAAAAARRNRFQNTRNHKSKFGRAAFDDTGLTQFQSSSTKNELIDKFLSEHVEDVWELGDEIRVRILSGIETSFDLAMNNPAGMVALVEAVEVYQTANDEYKAVHGVEAGSRSQTLRFTDMRAAALGALYKDFESRGLEVFQELTARGEREQAAAEEEGVEDVEAANQQFSAVIRAANELTAEIGIVKENMAPCFPPVWAIETLWTTCVAHVCSNNILQQIGGPDGHKLPDLSLKQLLELVAWVENFREIIEETFPNITDIRSKRAYLDQAPKLLINDNKAVDLEAAKDSLAWVNNTLWEVHDLAKDEFLFRTKEQTEEWLDNVYRADHTKSQTAEGRLVTSLCEDVYGLAGVQLRTIRERLTRRSEALAQAVGVVLKTLYDKQVAGRDLFCTDLETCCGASNDFVRMSEKCEEAVAEIQDECQLSTAATEILEEQAAALLGLYSSDAVYAAQMTHIFCFEPIEEAVGQELFEEDWLHRLKENELAVTIVKTLDDFMEDLENWLDEVMVQKTVEAHISAAVNFYIKCMLERAAKHNNNRASYFDGNNEKALARMRGDMAVMREHFEYLSETMPTLKRVITSEFDVLEAVVEVVSIAAGVSHSDMADFILVLQKRIRNVQLTKFTVGDLYHWVNPAEERTVYELVDTMEETMQAVAPTDDKAAAAATDRNTVPGLRLDQVIAKHCAENDDRKRPLKGSALESADKALRSWRASMAVSGTSAGAANESSGTEGIAKNVLGKFRSSIVKEEL